MSSVPADIHPLLIALRNAVAERGLTQSQAASEIGISERTLAYWLNDDVTPQKRFRPAIIEWLGREAA